MTYYFPLYRSIYLMAYVGDSNVYVFHSSRISYEVIVSILYDSSMLWFHSVHWAAKYICGISNWNLLYPHDLFQHCDIIPGQVD